MKNNLLENWIGNINSGNLEQLVSMYSPKALLFATFEKVPLNKPSLIREYFENFLSREGAGVEVDSSSVSNSELGKNIISSTGLYIFFFKDGDQLVRQKARFTFIFNFQNSGSILHHHSSVLPH
jgi:hypothetical protein